MAQVAQASTTTGFAAYQNKNPGGIFSQQNSKGPSAQLSTAAKATTRGYSKPSFRNFTSEKAKDYLKPNQTPT